MHPAELDRSIGTAQLSDGGGEPVSELPLLSQLVSSPLGLLTLAQALLGELDGAQLRGLGLPLTLVSNLGRAAGGIGVVLYCLGRTPRRGRVTGGEVDRRSRKQAGAGRD